jgi:hypothetical protein
MPEADHIDIRLPKSQIPGLLDLIALGHWIACAGESNEDMDYQNSLTEVEQTVFNQVLDQHPQANLYRSGDDNWCYHDNFDRPESKAWIALKEHEQETFWEELIMGLSQVLAMREAGEARWNSSSPEENFARSCIHEHRVRAVMKTHGLHGLFMVSPTPAE